MTPIKCHNGHQFLPLPGHPERDGKPRCPGCMANLLDAASGYEPERWSIPHPSVKLGPDAGSEFVWKSFDDDGNEVDVWTARRAAPAADVCHDPTVCVMAHCRITRSCHRLSPAPEPVECRISRGICVRVDCPNHDEVEGVDAGPSPFAGRDLGGRDRV